MRSKKAKAIRKKIYGDFADVRRYATDKNGVVRCIGLRKAYQQAKKGS